MLSIYKPVENAPIAAQKKRLICLKQTDWSKRGVPTTSTRCPDHLSRQFMTTASTFRDSPKNSSAEHFHDVSTCLILTNTLNHIDKHTHIDSFTLSLHLSLSHTHTLSLSLTHTHSLSLSLSLSLTHSLTLAHRDMYKEREYVRLRNFWCCMEMKRRWSGILC